MEGLKVGSINGAFEIIQSLDEADAARARASAELTSQAEGMGTIITSLGNPVGDVDSVHQRTHSCWLLRSCE